MANRFCSQCGAKLLSDASFCVECGAHQSGAKAPRPAVSRSLQRYAPAFVVLAVVLVAGGAVLVGLQTPKTPPTVPGRGAPQGPATAPANLPEGHPPLALPDDVKQVMRDMATKAAAAPDDVETWKHLAEMQYRASQVDPSYLSQAGDSYRHVLDREPENLDVIRNLGNIAFDQEQPEKAMELYERYLKQKPDDLSVQTDLATMYLSAGKADEAARRYQAVLQTDPSFFQAALNLAIAYRSMGQADQAVAALEKARGLAPDDQARTQVDHLIARLKGEPPAPPAQAPPAAAAAPAGTFQADAEAIFRQNPIMGPKVQRIEWSAAETAKVYLRDFPLDQMTDDMRSMFEDRMKGRIKEKKEAHQVTQTARFELVNDASGQVMDTITE